MTQTNNLPELLSAASLLLTLITFLYGLLYPELQVSMSIALGGRHPDDVGPDRMRVKAARVRASFLAITSASVGTIFSPSAIEVTCHFVSRLPHARAFDDYNAIATTLVVVTTGFFVLAGHAALMIGRLTRTLRGLTPQSSRS